MSDKCVPDNIYTPREMWRDYGAGPTAGNTYKIEYAFNNKVLDEGNNQESACIPLFNDPGGFSIKITFPQPIPLDPNVPNNIRFWAAHAGFDTSPNFKGNGNILVNGIPTNNDIPTQWHSGSPGSSTDRAMGDYIPQFGANIGTEISTIEWLAKEGPTGRDSYDWVAVGAIYINDKELVDADIPFPCPNPVTGSLEVEVIDCSISGGLYFAVQRGAETFSCKSVDLNSKLRDGDLLIVQRDGVDYAYAVNLEELRSGN